MEFLDRLLSDALWLVMWGIFAAALFLILILISGLFIRARWLAASCVAVLSIASAVVLIVLGSGPYSFGQWLFLLPGLVSLGISGWLAVEEWPGRTHYRPAT